VHLLNVPLGLEAPLAVSTVSATIVCGFMLARYAGSRARLAAREREHVFEEQIEDFLAGTLRGRDLLRAASELTADHFWDVVFSQSTHIGARGFRDLEPVLERSRHVSAERRALRDTSPDRRELAARRLGCIGRRRHYRALRHAMVAGPESVTLAAATALAHARDAGAFRWLMAHPRAVEHRRPPARLALLRAFGPRFVPSIAAALEAGIADPRMERAAIEALARARHGAALETIARRLRHEWRDVRVAAVRALGQLAARDRVDALAACLNDGEWQVRAQAAAVLGRLGATSHVGVLAKALRDPAWWVRRHAAYALASLGDAGRTALRAVAAHDDDAFAREMAAEALGGGFPRAARSLESEA